MAKATKPITLFQLTPAARELFALRDEERAARVALNTTLGRPTDLEHHSDASPEWIAARDRYHATAKRITALATAKAKAATREAIRAPITADSLVTLAAAADWYDGARATLVVAVQHLAGDDCYPMDLYSAE
jgi:hypothetical protein